MGTKYLSAAQGFVRHDGRATSDDIEIDAADFPLTLTLIL